jgi:hypothetical protein
MKLIKTTIRIPDDIYEKLSSEPGDSVSSAIRDILQEWFSDQSARSTMTTVERRCTYKLPSGVRCCRNEGHSGLHRFKCSGEYCPGLPWPASQSSHPSSCVTGTAEIPRDPALLKLIKEDLDDNTDNRR